MFCVIKFPFAKCQNLFRSVLLLGEKNKYLMRSNAKQTTKHFGLRHDLAETLEIRHVYRPPDIARIVKNWRL